MHQDAKAIERVAFGAEFLQTVAEPLFGCYCTDSYVPPAPRRDPKDFDA